MIQWVKGWTKKRKAGEPILLSKRRSRYKGVVWRSGSWDAQVVVGGYLRRIGTFRVEVDAAYAFDDYVVKYGLKQKTNMRLNLYAIKKKGK
jgi:hypothetical protein